MKSMPDCAGPDGLPKYGLTNLVRKYVDTIWLVRPENANAQTSLVEEMRTIATSLDTLLACSTVEEDAKLLSLGDVQMQRLKGLQRAHKDGHWGVASKMLLATSDEVSLTTVEELVAAQKAQLFQGKLLSNEEKLAGLKTV